jgi:hypothetical protein
LFYTRLFSIIGNIIKWDVKFDHFNASIVDGVKFNNLILKQNQYKNYVKAEELLLKPKFIYFLSGRLGISLDIKKAEISLSELPDKKKKRRFNLAKLMLLKRLNIDTLKVDRLTGYIKDVSD